MRRALIALAVVAGVLAMHGFTVDHRTAMGSISHGEHGEHGERADAHASMTPPMIAPDTGEPGASIRPASGPGHAMGELCLAFLTGLLLVLIGMIAASAQRSGPLIPFVRIDRPHRRERLPAPTPVELCVLRT